MDIQTKPGIVVAPPAQPFPDFGRWLSYNESVKSATAIRLGIKNVPTLAQYQNMQQVYTDYYAPACEVFGKIPVSSFFRCGALNRAIGGALNSAHLTGNAIDMDCDGIKSPTNIELFRWIKANLKYDQLILEAPDANGNPSWVHVANNRNNEPNREQALRMVRVKGKPVYEFI